MYYQFVELSYPKKPPFSLPLQHLLAFIAHCYFQRSAASTACTLVSALSFIVRPKLFCRYGTTFHEEVLFTRVPKSKTIVIF